MSTRTSSRGGQGREESRNRNRNVQPEEARPGRVRSSAPEPAGDSHGDNDRARRCLVTVPGWVLVRVFGIPGRVLAKPKPKTRGFWVLVLENMGFGPRISELEVQNPCFDGFRPRVFGIPGRFSENLIENPQNPIKDLLVARLRGEERGVAPLRPLPKTRSKPVSPRIHAEIPDMN